VILDREGALGGGGDALVGAVEETFVGDYHALRESALVDGETVILAGDLDLAGGEVLYRLVGAAMAAGELVGAGA